MELLKIFTLVFFFTFLLFQNSLLAQDYIVSGRVTDSETGQHLAGADVYLEETGTGVTTDSLGFFSLSLEKGEYRIYFSFIGYARKEKILEVAEDMTVNIELAIGNISLEEVVVSARSSDRNVEQIQMSAISVNAESIRNIPSFMGEMDILRTVNLLPGVQSAGDGNTGFFVRGGNADQNLVLFDGSVVYNPSHLFNFFSVFNPDAIEDLKLYKGGIPPSYGGRLSSVLDVRMKKGSLENYEVNGGIGLISSRLSIEGPLQKARSSFLLSGRRTYADMFLKLSSDENMNDTRLYFYDLNGKMNYVINDRNRIFISGYHGSDMTAFANLFGFDWGNTTGSMRWNRIFSDRFSGNLALQYSDYKFNLTGDIGPASIRWHSTVSSINMKTDFSYLVNDRNKVSFGLSSIYHNLDPGSINASIEGASVTNVDLSARNALEHGIYFNNEQNFWNNRLALVYGLRTSLFQVIGPGRQYIYDKADFGQWAVTDTIQLEKMKFYDNYLGWEPRVSLRFNLDAGSSVKVSYNRMVQYIHQAHSAQSVAPYDAWFMVSNNIPPQVADQVVIGYFRNFLSDRVETSVELYYKDLKNISDIIDNGNILGNELLEGQLRIGDGWSYGLEAFIRKDAGPLNGFLGYTFAKTRRKIGGINDGKPYNAPNDRRHDLSLSAGYTVAPALNVSFNFIYSSGRAYTLPSGNMSYQGSIAPVYGERNSSRLPEYHRLDFSLTYTPGKGNGRFESNWQFSLFNVYGRVNPISVSFAENPDKPGIPRSSFFYIPGPIPAITWNFNF